MSTKAIRTGLATLVIATTAFGTAACGSTAATPANAAPEAGQAVQQALERAVATGLPGAAAELREGDRSWWGRAGVGDITDGRQQRAEDRIRVGSISKAFTAFITLRLVADGELSLDDTVEKWLPGLVQGNGNDGGAITLRHLLNHTSGLRNFLEDQKIFDNFVGENYLEHRFDNLSPVEIVEIAVKFPPYFAPGGGFRYSNVNHDLLGLIIEKATGRTFAAELERLVVVPFQLSGTYLPPDGEFTIRGPHSRMYSSLASLDPAAPVHDVTDINASWGYAAGGIVSTTADLSRFLEAILRGELLPAELHREMWTTVSTEGAGWIPQTRYGAGIFEQTLPCGTTVYGMAGAINGAFTYSMGTRDGERTIVATVNADHGTALGALIDITSAALCPAK
ncbi:serine hydrolase domain-containing protein [Nocardia salmonicida]|uniref:serine hydrolase domain-containing protein n=1 Tax=Nocardia salmonicida TaxID=53431 RepID=UPI0007C702A1|nr:serine hydrolase domain-containing protein [Nocardia salmonicida]